ncbi:MAG TPA: ParB N-terminal domain-containing protein [Flavipsychrobacter sp.]|nr:ParB N-terminal domain-containing protein [Flavipsychrobacter sp.]
MNSIIKKNITDLKPHPENEKIYTALESIVDLVDSIRAQGQLVPITINDEDVIISGHRRVLAMKELQFQTVDAIIKHYESPELEVMELIEFNTARVKTTIEVFNEIKHYREMYGKRQGQRSDLENGTPYKGSTKEIIADALGIGATNVMKIQFIYDTDPELLISIDKGLATINSAYKNAQAIRKNKEEKVEKVKENLERSTSILFGEEPQHPEEVVSPPESEDTEVVYLPKKILSEDNISQIVNLLEKSNARFCVSPCCTAIVDVIELIKNHRYEEAEKQA